MITIGMALGQYRDRIEALPPDRFPQAWATHYDGDTFLGAMGAAIPEGGPAHAMFWLLLPFGVSYQVTTSVMFFEAYTAPTFDTRLFEADRVLYATQLHDDSRGIWTTHYTIPYFVGDYGTRYYLEPEKAHHWVPAVNDCIDHLLNARRNAHWTFEEAVAATINVDL